VRVAVRRIEGVASVTVSLDSGRATIRFAAENRATLDQIRETIRRNGFTPKSAEVRIRGTLVERDGKLALALPGGGFYWIHPQGKVPDLAARLRSNLPGTVEIEGTVPEGRKDAPDTIEVSKFTPRSG